MQLKISPALLAVICTTASSQTRVDNSTVDFPQDPPPVTYSVPNAFPGISFSRPLALRTPPGETERLFVCEKGSGASVGGDIRVIPDVRNPVNEQFLDLNGIVEARPNESFLTSSEMGLLSMAFHPDYATNGYFFVVYNVNDGSDDYQRLSRFEVSSGNRNRADTNSETIFIQQINDAGNHNGGDIHFGPDGYLYMSWGDEGGSNDILNNSQTVTKDFWSSITRIDVDRKVGNIEPQSHPAVMLDSGGVAYYSVPADNPAFSNGSLPNAAVRTEFWAIGLRNPWRMSFDPITGKLYVGDVGQGAREEIDEIIKGQNYGWAFREGRIGGPRSQTPPLGWTDREEPLWDYRRGSGTLQGNSVTGGVVYRGDRLQELIGKYIFGDHVSGNIWAFDLETSEVIRLTGNTSIVGYGYDPSNGDILMADLGDGIVRRLVSEEVTGDFPQTLSATGVFSSVSNLTPNPGVVAYDVNVPFWSDFAEKQRWFVIPDVPDRMGYSEDGVWTFPSGSVWIKHFELELTRGDPSTAKRIETRVIVKNDEGCYGVSYRWNEAGTGAALVPEAGVTFDLTVTEGGAVRTQTWEIPSRANCLTCHTSQAGHLLSFNTRQLNRPGMIGGVNGNFVSLLSTAGYLIGNPADSTVLPRHSPWSDTDVSLEARARSYLDVNCAYCHMAGGIEPESFSALANLPLGETGMVDGVSNSGVQNPQDRIIVPGSTDRSIIWNRIGASNGYTRMPPLASNEIDNEAVSMIGDWIGDQLPDRETFQDWRERQFGDVVTPEGAPEADPDGDGRTNRSEFLLHSDPGSGSNGAEPTLVVDGSDVDISFLSFRDRKIMVEASMDLITWTRWEVPENDGVPLRNDTIKTLSGPAAEPHLFFRLLVEEN